VQRSSSREGSLNIEGTIGAESSSVPDLIEARLITGNSERTSLSSWQHLSLKSATRAFRGEISAPAGGWYRLEVRALQQDGQLGRTTVEHVGIGEIFVIAGQSNAANYGAERQKPSTGLVVAFDGAKWRIANDPQPGAGGSGGSFMPAFGDAIAKSLHVPVGIVALGIGSTSVREWLPSGVAFTNPPAITRNVASIGAGKWQARGQIFTNFTARLKALGLRGFRAVLWHQGESDANQSDATRTLSGQLYQDYLTALILDCRKEIGWDTPWFVAQATYHSTSDPASTEIRAAQRAVCDTGVALTGPDTDTLTGAMRDHNGLGVHFSGLGLGAHGKLWADKITPWLAQQVRAENLPKSGSIRANARPDN
jgi:hypothetical protein